MSLVDYLFTNRTKLELAKELAQTAKEKADLQTRLAVLEHELFWYKTAITRKEPPCLPHQ